MAMGKLKHIIRETLDVFNLEKEGQNLAKAAHLVPWLLWRIWKNRNELISKGKEYNAQEVLTKAMEDQEEWERREAEANGPRCPPNPPARETREAVKWKKPPQGWVKCNTDGAWSKEGNRWGIGWVLRDNQGKVLWVGARALPRTRTVMEMETEALRWAVLFMSRLNYQNIIFESDAQELIKLLNSGEGWPHLDPQLQDIRSLLPNFNEVKFVFSSREGNKAADRVARESSSLENYDPKVYSIMPNWLKSIVELDMEM